MIDRLGRVIFESDTNDSLSKVKAIVSKIRDHVKRTDKPPTGNQNCRLCTWCTEAHMRGFDVLPRPVYSPRDPVFNIKGESIVKNPIRQSLGSGLRSGIENLLDLTEIEGGRWYCHVNWHGSQGGHEFILMRINKVLYVVDSQQGLVANALSERGGEYFNDINWGNSYIVRLDDKEFNEEMFMKNNDPSQTLPWDEDLNIPYMRENGMLPDEDINEAKVERINDEGDTVPEKCDKCGSHVGLYLKGEPVWLCSNKKCGKYFGTAPCNFQEATTLKTVDMSKMEKIYYWSPIRLAPDQDQGDIITIEHDSPRIFVTDKIGLCPFYTLYDSEIFENIIKKYNADIVPVLPRNLDELSKEENIVVKLISSEAKPKYGDFTLYVYEVDKSSVSNIVHDKKYKSEYLYAIPRKNGDIIISAKPVKVSKVHYTIKPELSNTFQESTLPDGVFLRLANESDLPNIIKWKLESVNPKTRNDPKTIRFIENDAKENLKDTKMIMSYSTVIGVLESCYIDDGEWWYIGEIYLIPEYRGKGIARVILQQEIDSHDKLKLRVSKDNTHAIDLYKSLGFGISEEDEYAYTMTLVKDHVQEGNDLTNNSNHSPTSVCENMVRDLKRYAYGIPVNGKIQNVPSSEYFDKHYRLLSPDEFEKYGGGVCWDYVEFMEGYLDAYGYSCKKYYIFTDTKDGDTHTFITVDDGKGGLLYPESSFKLIEGLHKVKNVEEAIKMIASKMFEVNNNSKKYSEIKYYVWEYTGHPEYGSNCVQCTEYFSKGEPFYEGTAINPNKQKIVKESVRMSYPDRFGNNTMTQLSPRMTTDDVVVQEGMFDAGFSNLRMKIAKALEGRFKVTNVFKSMGGKDKFDIVAEDSNDGIKTSVESTGNGCKVVSRGMGKMKSHFNNISLSAAFDRIISLFEQPEVLLEGALPCSFRAFMEADDDSDDDSVDLNSFGSDNDGSSPNNQYDEEEVSRLNELISDENHAVGQYFEAAKTTNDEVLRRLFSDIGNEERFHTEQLLYAKSTITGEKYEPMDKDVKKEYEELIAMGMDEDDAFNTAIDRQHLNAEDDGDDSDMEELEVDTKNLGESFQYYTDCIELCEIITESDLFESGSEAIRNSMIVMESVLYMEEVGSIDQQKGFLKNNPITFIIKGFFSFIKFINGLVDKIKLFVRKVQTKQRRMHDWIKRNGIKQLFANGINMYFYDDRDLNHVNSSALLYCDMLCRIVELIAKDMGLNFQSRHKINDTSKIVQFNNVDDGLRRFKEVVFSKTKIVVNENNEQKLAELFFGYSQGKLPTGKSVNIYHTLDMVANEIKKASEEVNNFITSIGALDKDLNSIYYKDPKKYRLGVDRLNKVYKGLTIIGKALASDMNEVLKLNNGLLEKTRTADANDMGINPNNNN